MLIKLLKYEFKATGRMLLPLYCVLIIFSLISKMFMLLSERISYNYGFVFSLGSVLLSFISVFIYIFIMVAIFVVTLFIVVQRYHNNLLCDEGYLMNTLPVTACKNILAKLICAVTWGVTSFTLSIISISILNYNQYNIEYFPYIIGELFDELFDDLSIFFVGQFGYKFSVILVEMFILGILLIITAILLIYASMSIGHSLSKFKILASFGAFGVFIVITGITYLVLSVIHSVFVYIMLYFGSTAIDFQVWFFVLAGICLITSSIIYFLLSKYFMEKRFNLK